jgi:hypothetical protein
MRWLRSAVSAAAGAVGAVAIAAIGVLGACAGPAAELRDVPSAGFASAADFAGADRTLTGFDAAVPGGDWRAGDEVLFGLRLARDGACRHWLLHLRLVEPVARARGGGADGAGGGAALPPFDWPLRVNGVDTVFASTACRVVATVADADGSVLGRSEPLLPRDFLAGGFADACRLVAARRAQRAEHDAAAGTGGNGGRDGGDAFYRGVDVLPFARATVAAVALLRVVEEDGVLAPLLWHVVERPSLWSVVTALGVRVLLRPRFHAAEPSPSPVAAAGPAWRVPMTLVVNDAPALLTELYVVPSAPPFALCGGIVAAMARHPTDPTLEFSLLLLAARRGPDRPAPPAPSLGGTPVESRTRSGR